MKQGLWVLCMIQPYLMNMLAISSLFLKILRDIEIGLLGRFNRIRYNFKSEGTEFLQIHPLNKYTNNNTYLTIKHLLLDVLGGCFEYDVELSFRLQWLIRRHRTRNRLLMLTRVVIRVLQYPKTLHLISLPVENVVKIHILAGKKNKLYI